MSGEVPAGWRPVRLGEVARETRARNGDLKIPQDRLVGVFKNEGMTPARDRVRGENVERCKIVRPGAFAYNPMRLNIGSIARWHGSAEAIVSPDYIVFEADPARLDGGFLDHLRASQSWRKFTEGAGDGGVRIRIYFDHLAEFRFPLPPLAEQRLIAEILTSVDEVIQATQAVIEQTRKVKESVLQRLLTKGIGHTRFKQTEIGEIPEHWNLLNLGSLLADVDPAMRSGPFGSALLKEELVEDGTPLLGIDNVHVERFDRRFRRFVTPEKYQELRRYAVRANDVMITIMGTVGRCCVVPDDVGPALSSKHVWTLTFDDARYLPDLLCWQLNHAPWALQEFMRSAQGGVMSAINSSVLRGVRVPVPPMDEQRHIYAALLSFNNTIAAEEERLTALDASKAALMADLLTGRRRVASDLPLAAE